MIAVSNKKNTTLKFSVKDTGLGIKVENKEKIFNSFVQEDNSTNRKLRDWVRSCDFKSIVGTNGQAATN
jgi:signal transduction histidine kinase